MLDRLVEVLHTEFSWLASWTASSGAEHQDSIGFLGPHSQHGSLVYLG